MNPKSAHRVAIDDFGTGYSSMTRLGDLPIDVLKIDRSFLRRRHNENQTMSMMQALSTLAKSFGLATVAEGVETTQQLDLVRRCGYDLVQGFLFAKPIPAGHVATWLRAWELRQQRARYGSSKAATIADDYRAIPPKR